jgi:hypothetical protein
MSTYCANWTVTSLPRPTDRNPERTKAWIEEIYQNKKYLVEGSTSVADDGGNVGNTAATPSSAQGKNEQPSPLQQNGHGTPSGTGDSTVSNDEDVVHVLELTDLGAGMAKLEIGGPVVASSSTQPKSPPAALPRLQIPGTTVLQPPSPAAKAASSSPAGKSEKSEKSKSPRPAVEAVAVPEPAVEVVAAPTPSLMDSWDPFGDVEPAASTPEVVVAPATTTTAAPIAVEEAVANGNGATTAPASAAVEDGGWNAFADTEVQTATSGPEDKAVESTTPAALHELLSPSAVVPAAPEVPPQPQPASSPAPGWAVDFGGQSVSPQPAPQQQQQQQQQQHQQQQHHQQPAAPAPVAAVPGRKEISLDTFYPEFETIRATGVLPTGQNLLQAQMTQWGVSPAGQQYHQNALPSPGYAPLSPQQQHFQQQQQQQSMYAAGTPTGSYYPAPSTVYAQQQHQQQQYVSPSMMQHQQYMPSPSPQPLPSPASSVASFGRPTNGISTAHSQEKLGTDPFAHLAPTGVGNQGQMQSTTPTPAPIPSPPPPVAAAFSVPSGVAPGSQTQAASATLFGTGTNITAYDLSAPAAPKPRSSGNPFA